MITVKQLYGIYVFLYHEPCCSIIGLASGPKHSFQPKNDQHYYLEIPFWTPSWEQEYLQWFLSFKNNKLVYLDTIFTRVRVKTTYSTTYHTYGALPNHIARSSRLCDGCFWSCAPCGCCWRLRWGSLCWARYLILGDDQLVQINTIIWHECCPGVSDVCQTS